MPLRTCRPGFLPCAPVREERRGPPIAGPGALALDDGKPVALPTVVGRRRVTVFHHQLELGHLAKLLRKNPPGQLSHRVSAKFIVIGLMFSHVSVWHIYALIFPWESPEKGTPAEGVRPAPPEPGYLLARMASARPATPMSLVFLKMCYTQQLRTKLRWPRHH